MKLITKAIYLASALSLTACSDDFFDVNSSVTSPTTESLAPQYRIQGAIENTFAGTLYRGSREVLGVCQYGSQNVANYYSEVWNNEFTTGRYFLWQNSYVYSLPNTADLIVLGKKYNSPNFVAVGKIIRAYIFGVTTDQYGDIVMDDTYDGESPMNITPKFVTQKEAYDKIIAMLDEAIAEINQPSDIELNAAQGDVFYQGDKAKWTQLAYALKARYLNHLAKKSSYDPDAVLEACANAFKSNADNAMRTYEGGVPENDNQPYSSRGYGSSRVDYWSEFFVETLKNSLNLAEPFQDPRLITLVPEAVNGGYKGVRTGEGPVGEKDDYSIGNGGYYTSATSPTYFMTYSEVKFIEAEAYFRKGDKAAAYAALKEGVTADLEKAGVAPADAAEYLAKMDTEVGASNVSLSHIMTQKYISLVFDPETWVDLRRMDYSSEIYNGLQRPAFVNLSIFPNDNDWIQAMVYEYNESDRNYENLPNNDATYRLTTPLWWNTAD
ncbi:SusD/RagB family nutrient-binding outer membrane lipoprotein [Marinilongibacter aquaticus]|uniref:SusD/RagB family nutrient-binding outer membrane lipoprotein n=1 Tax=Marinilongibacter aquaticus TaxID=2975157 RepID=UPI0021BD9DE2|nr:SusD/RagB family nutrient-binding outer membrane lipoprotein [Marinilongibacter aquaticus]UBM57694.1 SusD/RagB family nutrient-binding outer membrane lipoprotein [Marinilongibacter aquaticus]